MGLKFYRFFAYVMVLSGVGCSNYYFDSPQPVDAQSLFEFPKRLQGVWGEDDGGVVIGSNYFTVDEVQTDTLTAAAFRKNYVIANNKAFKVPTDTVNGSFSNGLSYAELFGQFVVREDPLDKRVHLGPRNFLRKCGEGYLLNLEESSGWYSLVYVRSLTKKSIEVSFITLTDSMINVMKSNNQFVGKLRDDYYFSIDWTSEIWQSNLTEGNMVIAFDTLTRISKKIK